MQQLKNLFSKYDRLVIFDTETTGLQYNRDEIIEFAAVVVEQRDGKAEIIEEYAKAFKKVALNYKELLADDPGNPETFGRWNFAKHK